MFARKKRPRKALVISGAQSVLFSGGVEALCLPEDVVLALSMEYFQDPAPCEIHRTAVLHRAFEELEHACGDKGVAVSALPGRLRAFLGAYPSAQRLHMAVEEAE